MDEQSKNPITKKFSVKLIFLILGIVVLLELIIGLKVLSGSNPPSQNYQVTSPVPTTPLSRIDVLSSKNEYKIDDQILVSIVVDTAGKAADGTDLFLLYDPKKLEATSGAIRKGSIYGEYPVAEVSPQEGLIKISGVSKIGQESFSGRGELAVLNFRAKEAGKTSLKIDYTPGRTTDSNIVESETAIDILGKVNNLEINILP